jgi:hypothetical protein
MITGTLTHTGMIGDFIMAQAGVRFFSDFPLQISWIGTFIVLNIVINTPNYQTIIIIITTGTASQ